MDKEKYSAYVKKARAKADMTLHEFGEAIGTSWVTVWRWENQYTMPRMDAVGYWIKEIDKV